MNVSGNLVSITKPNSESLENIVLKIGDEIGSGEQGSVKIAELGGELVALKEFYDWGGEGKTSIEKNNAQVMHSYDALNTLKELDFHVIDDYGYVTLPNGKKFLLMKLLNKVIAEQFFVRNGKGIDDLPIEAARKIRKNKKLMSIHNISFGVCDEHMIYENDEGIDDICISDVGAFSKSQFTGNLAKKISRDNFQNTDFIEIYKKMLNLNENLTNSILKKYEIDFPGRLETLLLEYQSFISRTYRSSGIPFSNREYEEYAKKRGYLLKNNENYFEGILFNIDQDYYFENQFRKRIFCWNSNAKKNFADFDSQKNIDDNDNLKKAYFGIDIAYQAALDIDITYIRDLLNDIDNPIKPEIRLDNGIPQLHTLLDRFEENETINGELYLEKYREESKSFLVRVPLSLRDYVFGKYTQKTYLFNPEDVQEVFSEERNWDSLNSPLIVKKASFSPSDIKFGFSFFGACYYLDNNTDTTILSEVCPNKSHTIEFYEGLSSKMKTEMKEEYLSFLERIN